MNVYSMAVFENSANDAVVVAVEPWATVYTLNPGQRLIVESVHEDDTEVPIVPFVEFTRHADGSVTISCARARPLPAPIHFQLGLPKGVRITAPDRVDTVSYADHSDT